MHVRRHRAVARHPRARRRPRDGEGIAARHGRARDGGRRRRRLHRNATEGRRPCARHRGGERLSRVFVAMSGGVDSSVAAALLAEGGHDVVGVWLRLPRANGDPDAPRCCGTEQAGEDARRAAAVLGIPFYALDYAEVFGRDVVDRFVDSYAQGETPNPCVACNHYVKFEALMADVVRKFGADRLATGHYARVTHDGAHRLLRARDAAKDQSYALYMLAQRVGTREEVSATTYELRDVTFTADVPPAGRFRTNAVLRYRGTPLAGWVTVHADGALLDLDRPALVAPGQAAVFYDGDEVVGGGIVTATRAA